MMFSMFVPPLVKIKPFKNIDTASVSTSVITRLLRNSAWFVSSDRPTYGHKGETNFTLQISFQNTRNLIALLRFTNLADLCRTYSIRIKYNNWYWQQETLTLSFQT